MRPLDTEPDAPETAAPDLAAEPKERAPRTAGSRRPARRRRRFFPRPSPLFWAGLGITVLLALLLANWTALRSGAADRAGALRRAVVDHPEFAIRFLDVQGHRQTGLDEIARAVGVAPEMNTLSSLQFDAKAARETLIALPWIEAADVMVDPSGTLRLRLREREASALWLSPEGYWLIDAQGQRIVPVEGPQERLDLPLLIGFGADAAVSEARTLLFALPPAATAKIHALVRRGGRRWDAVLQGGLVVKLPEAEPLEALRAYFRSGLGARVAPRAVTSIDLRLPGEPPVLRLESGVQSQRLEALENLRNAAR